jgi:hypothetical protein
MSSDIYRSANSGQKKTAGLSDRRVCAARCSVFQGAADTPPAGEIRHLPVRMAMLVFPSI